MVALGGNAVGLPGKKKIDRNDLQRNVVKSSNIKNETIGSGDIGTGAVGASEIANGQVGSAEIGAGQVGSGDVVGCSAGTQLVNGLCWETAATVGLHWANAADDCAASGGRLPSIEELNGAKNTPGFDYGTSPAALNHYSDTVYEDDGVQQMATVAEDASYMIDQNVSDDHSYRCVFERIR